MSEIVFYMLAPHVSTFRPIMDELPREMVTLCLADATAAHAPLLKGLRADGYRVVAKHCLEQLHPRLLVVDNSRIANDRDGFVRRLSRSIKTVGMAHSLGHRTPKSYLTHFNLLFYEKQLDFYQEIAHRDVLPQEFAHICELPPVLKHEFAYVGPYHMGRFLQKRSREERRADMEDALGMSLPSDKPVVACFGQGNYHNEVQLFYGMKQLARHCTLINKNRFTPVCDALLAEDEAVNGILTWPDSSAAANVLRFGADTILCGAYGGTALSSLMANLPFIPFYTKLTTEYGGRDFFYTARCQTRDFIAHALKHIGWLFDIQDTGLLAEVIHNPRIQTHFRESFEEMKRYLFGRYTLDDPAKKAALLIVHLLHHDTWGEKAFAALPVCPEANPMLKEARP